MQFKSIGMSNKVAGSSLVGYVDVPYQMLVETFGEPSENDGHKVDAEWCLEFKDGTIATIYNYKSGRNYLGPQAPPVEEIIHWHIGGFNPKAERLVKKALELGGAL
jgi:hypothetical protein